MPYHVGKNSSCPADKPWAVIKDSDGAVMGCHASEDGANDQMKALYANESSSAMPIERRCYQVAELRAQSDGDNLRLIGHAAVFNQQSEEIFFFREIVLPGAFKNSIKQHDIRALWNHDPAFVLGRNRAGTLRLKEDDVGLRTEIDLPDTQFARDLYRSVKRGDVDQMSFGFRTITDNWRKQDGVDIRELVEVELFDVSPVTFPAYPQTDISARSFYEARARYVAPAPPAETAEEFKARLEERRQFIESRMPKPDPLDYHEIIKRVRNSVAK